MSYFPHCRLLVGPAISVVFSGPHIQTISSSSGTVLTSTARLDPSQKDNVLKSGHVRCAIVDASCEHLATTGDDKKLKVWKLEGLKLLSERELPKKPTDIKLTSDGQTILISDKFGDVFSYPLHPKPEEFPLIKHSKRDPLSSHENPWGHLVLGHVSLLTSFLLTHDERYIITADRDEHIRVSWYPEGYSIESYCLGHKHFVSAIHIPDFAPDTLISGGGDAEIKVWDWLTGTLKHEIRILEVVEPLIEVKPPSRWRGYNDDGEGSGDDSAEEEEGEQPVRTSKQGHRKKKGKQREQPLDDDPAMASGLAPDPGEANVNADETVLVLHKIRSLHNKRLIFSAVGATALFSAPFPDSTSAHEVVSFDFGKPVIDFETAADGDIWVLLDAQWGDSSDRTTPVNMVRVIRWINEEFIEPETHSPLLNSLNTECLLSATSDELSTLDIYSPLSALPKDNRVRRNPANRQQKVQESKSLTRRAKGRLKAKTLLAQVKGELPVQNDMNMGESSSERTKKPRSEV